MSWIGKILGAIFGYFVFGPVGALIGFLIGNLFDRGLKVQWSNFNSRPNPLTQKIFLDSSFAVMGYVAKADGRVSERELELARLVMQRMGVVGEAKYNAMRLFNAGKEPNFNLTNTLNKLKIVCRNPQVLRMFLELQVQIAYADGSPGNAVRNLLQQISQHLGLGPLDFSHIESMLYGQWGHWQQQGSNHYQQPGNRPQTSLSKAYEIIGVASSALPADIKKAYRRKMNENHPDKMIAKGLPKEMIELATAKTQQIQAAYEQIKQARNFI